MSAAIFLEQARSEKTRIHAEMMSISNPKDRAMLINLATEEPSKFNDLIDGAKAFQRLQDVVVADGKARVLNKPGYEDAVLEFDNLFWAYVPLYVKAPSFAEVKVDFKTLMKVVKTIASCIQN